MPNPGSPPKVYAALREDAMDERWARARLTLSRELAREHQCHDESCDEVEVTAYRVVMHLRGIVEGRV